MLDIVDTPEGRKWRNRINLQLAVGIIGMLIVFVGSSMSTMTQLLMIMTQPSDWIYLQFYSNFILLIGFVFGIVGILGFLTKHEFRHLWIFAVLLLIGLLYRTYYYYIVNWSVEVVGNASLFTLVSQSLFVVELAITTICLLMIRSAVRNQILLWAVILGPFIEVVFSSIWWAVLYGTGPQQNVEWITLIPYYLGTLIVGTFLFGIFTILLYLDERKYTSLHHGEPVQIRNEYES